jgi:hypothetical protein
LQDIATSSALLVFNPNFKGMSAMGSDLADSTSKMSDTVKNLTIINNYNNMNKEKKSTVTAM